MFKKKERKLKTMQNEDKIFTQPILKKVDKSISNSFNEVLKPLYEKMGLGQNHTYDFEYDEEEYEYDDDDLSKYDEEIDYDLYDEYYDNH